jgi:putative phosphoribosyl transferase
MTARPDYFINRQDAGRRLAQALIPLGLVDPIVLALPRGGVPIGYEVAAMLSAPLDILLVRKIGAPGHKEYGIGALVDGAAPHVVIDAELARRVGADQRYIDQQVAHELGEIERRRAAYRTGPSLPLNGRTVIVVDDGIATGGTVRAALKALAKAEPARIILAAPLAPRAILPELEALCDDVVILASPDPFYAVGAHYQDFSQTSDEEVIHCLAASRQAQASSSA